MIEFFEKIESAVDKYAMEIIEWTKSLVRFDSENRPPDGNEAESQVFIADECAKLGLEVDKFNPTDVEGIESHESFLPERNYPAGRDNVVACWRGTGKGKSILFSGHVDVAPYEPDDWKVCRPYEPVVKDGRLYGRGSADMKGGLSAAFWAVKILREVGFEPGGDILFESVVDEEFAGGNGTLAARLRGYNTDLVVVAEPTQMRLCPASFGAFLFDLTIKGQAGMPYLGTEIPNPANGAGRVIEFLRELEEKWQQQYSHPLFVRDAEKPKIMVWEIDSTRPGEFTQLGTPLQVKLSCVIWCYPGVSEEQIRLRFEESLSEMYQVDPIVKSLKVEVTPTYHFVKPWETELTEPIKKAIETTFGNPVITGAPYSCDLGVYGDAGIPAVLYGPRCDNLHAPDEWVNVDDILQVTRNFAKLAVLWSSGKDKS
jgi:acetylornithine deacetylase